MSYVLEFDYRSDGGPRLVGPFPDETAASEYVDKAHRASKPGTWSATYNIAPLAPPT